MPEDVEEDELFWDNYKAAIITKLIKIIAKVTKKIISIRATDLCF